MPRVANEEREREIIARYLKGEPATEIAKNLSLSLAAIYKTLQRKGINRTGQSVPIPDKIKHEIINRYLAGNSATDIADALNIARASVYNILDKANVGKQRPHK